jgi:hypothetical protein
MEDAQYNNAIQEKNSNVLKELHVVPSEAKASCELDKEQLNRSIEAWDEIGELTSEVASSMIARQASVICERFMDNIESQEQRPPLKKRKLSSPETNDTLPSSTLVSSDENSDANSETTPSNLSIQIDRMGRMSKIALQLENCRRLLRAEMVAMAEDHEMGGSIKLDV